MPHRKRSVSEVLIGLVKDLVTHLTVPTDDFPWDDQADNVPGKIIHDRTMRELEAAADEAERQEASSD